LIDQGTAILFSRAVIRQTWVDQQGSLLLLREKAVCSGELLDDTLVFDAKATSS
jgi:hypothetical protein